MDWDEDHLGDCFFDDEDDEEKCTYCGEKGSLNVVHYAINSECNVYTLAVNPKPHERFLDKLREGYVHRIDKVCDSCLEEEERNGD